MSRAHSSFILIAGEEVSPLAGTEPFHLSCDKDGCVNNCCTKSAPVVLNPYEIEMICRAAGLAYDDFLDTVETGRLNGFPMIMLPRDPACHFWTGTGCGIYSARPLACRLFPLGRVFHEGRSHIVLPTRNICIGVSKQAGGSVAEYLSKQDVGIYMDMADIWIGFVSEIERLGLPDRPVTSVAFHLLIYSPDAALPAGFEGKELLTEERFVLKLENAKRDLVRFLGAAR